MHAVVGQDALMARQGAVAAGTLVAADRLQGLLVADRPLTLLGRGRLLALQALAIRLEPGDQGPANHHREQRPDPIADVAAKRGQVGHQLHEEGEQGKQEEPPHERPLLTAPVPAELPQRQGQQGPHEQQPDREDAQLRALPCPGQLPFSLAAQPVEAALLRGDGGLHPSQPLLEPLPLLAELALPFQLKIKLACPVDHLRVLIRLRGGRAGGAPVLEGRLVAVVGLTAIRLALLNGLQLIRQRLPATLQWLEAVLQPTHRRTIKKLLTLRGLAEQGQIGDHRTAHLDQEVGEQQGNQPLTGPHQPFRTAGRTDHRRSLGGSRSGLSRTVGLGSDHSIQGQRPVHMGEELAALRCGLASQRHPRTCQRRRINAEQHQLPRIAEEASMGACKLMHKAGVDEAHLRQGTIAAGVRVHPLLPGLAPGVGEGEVIDPAPTQPGLTPRPGAGHHRRQLRPVQERREPGLHVS